MMMQAFHNAETIIDLYSLQVTTPSEKAALSGQWTRESPYTMMIQAFHNAETVTVLYSL